MELHFISFDLSHSIPVFITTLLSLLFFLQTQLQIEQTTIHPEHFFKGVNTIKCHRYRTKSSSVIEYNTMCKPFVIRLQRCGYLKKSTSNVTYLGTILHLMTTFIKSQNLVLAIFITVRTPNPPPPPPKKRTQINIYPIPSILLQRVFS